MATRWRVKREEEGSYNTLPLFLYSSFLHFYIVIFLLVSSTFLVQNLDFFFTSTFLLLRLFILSIKEDEKESDGQPDVAPRLIYHVLFL